MLNSFWVEDTESILNGFSLHFIHHTVEIRNFSFVILGHIHLEFFDKLTYRGHKDMF